MISSCSTSHQTAILNHQPTSTHLIASVEKQEVDQDVAATTATTIMPVANDEVTPQVRNVTETAVAKADTKAETKKTTKAGSFLRKAPVTSFAISTINKLKPNSASAGGEKSWIVALLLVIFLGGLGIHRFYLGYIWQGVVQLLTAGGCGIWALIDLIRIAMRDLQPLDGEYID